MGGVKPARRVELLGSWTRRSLEWLAGDSQQQTRGVHLYLLRGLCVIVATIGFMTAISPFYGPENSYPTVAVLGVGWPCFLGECGTTF
jgi:hypothetical protein